MLRKYFVIRVGLFANESSKHVKNTDRAHLTDPCEHSSEPSGSVKRGEWAL
jgi:hypothetical protein